MGENAKGKKEEGFIGEEKSERKRKQTTFLVPDEATYAVLPSKKRQEKYIEGSTETRRRKKKGISCVHVAACIEKQSS